MLSVFQYFAKTSYGLDKYLQRELDFLQIDSRFIKQFNQFEFRADYQTIFNVVHRCQTIEHLKIQIGHDIRARDEDDLQKNLASLPFHAFFHPYQFDDNNPPLIRAKSYRSGFFHEKAIAECLQRYLVLIPQRKLYQELNLGTKSILSPQEVNRVLEDEKRQYMEDEIKLLQQSLKQPSLFGQELVVRKLKDQSGELNIFNQNGVPPSIHVYMVKNWAQILLQVNTQDMYQHGQKFKVGWGPIKESIVSGAIMQIAIQQQINNGNNIRIWDPFCGSGTILMEVVSNLSNKLIRLKLMDEEESTKNHTDEQEDFRKNRPIIYKWRNFPEKDYEDWLKKEIKKFQELGQEKLENQEKANQIEIIGSDISNIAINNVLYNFNKSKIDSHLLSYSDFGSIDKKAIPPFLKKYNFSGRKISIFQGDFEMVSEYIDFQGLTVISNIPYGQRSKEQISRNELQSIYRRFSKILLKNLDQLKDVYIFYPLRTQNGVNFLNYGNLEWESIEEFNSGGIQIGLFRLNKSLTKTNSVTALEELEEKLLQKKENARIPINQETSIVSNDNQKKELEQLKEQNLQIRADIFKQHKVIMLKLSEKIQSQIAKIPGTNPHDKKVLLNRKQRDLLRKLQYKHYLQGLQQYQTEKGAGRKFAVSKMRIKRNIKHVTAVLQDQLLTTNQDKEEQQIEIMNQLQSELDLMKSKQIESQSKKDRRRK